MNLLLFQTVTAVSPLTVQPVASNTEFLYNSTVILLLGLGSLISFFIWAWYLTRREKKPFGEVLSLMAVHQNESIFVAVVIIIFFAEAVLAASVHAPGEMLTPPLPRFISHVIISVCGTVASVTFIKDFASVFEPKLDWASRIARTIIVGGISLLALGIPLGNAVLISAGLGEDLKFYLFVVDYFNPFIDDYEFNAIVRHYGGPINYQSWGAMSYVLKTTCFLTACHVIMSVVEGARNMGSPERRKKLFSNPYEEPKKEEYGKDIDKKKEDRKERDDSYAPTPGEKRAEEALEENLRKLLSRIRYRDEELEEKVKKARSILYDTKVCPKAEHRVKLSAMIMNLVNQTKQLDLDKSLSKEDKADKNNRLKSKIRRLFASSPKATEIDKMGLGMMLKGDNGKEEEGN